MAVDSVERGVLAGSVAGLAYGLFVAGIANPLVSRLEEQAEHQHAGAEHAHAVVSETTTAAVSVGSGVLWGILLGGVFGLAYYLLEPALPGRQGVKPYVLAGTGFLTVSVAPWLVLPPATPGVEHALATSQRLLLYGGMMLVGAVLAAGTVLTYRRVTGVASPGRAGATSFASLAVVLAALAVGTPTLASSGLESAALARVFQGSVVLSQAALWTVLAGVYEQLTRRRRTDEAVDVSRARASP